ncbi:rod shape-determining protein MreC [Paenibacillus zeirhizosphaerae]|uniref:rod shape-determining protein MreC n=1 Tax=Paenibacillus zeirhizosphaerae TaxID=2987519 RepID=UPI00352021DF
MLIGIVMFIALMGFTLGQRESLSWPEKFVRDTTGFVQRIFYKPAALIAGFFEDIGNMKDIYEENERLKIAAAQYHADKVRFSGLEEENTRLEEALNFTETQRNKYKYENRIAQVVSVSGDPTDKTLVIDIGSKDGIKPGMAVRSIDGLVGTISNASNFSSTVKLLTSMDAKDPTSNGIAVTVVGKEKSFGVLENYNAEDRTFEMSRIEEDDPIKVGDQIMTSGSGGKFPKYLLIGKVKEIRVSEYGQTRTAIIEPAANFTDWKELFVVFTPEVQE